MGIFTICCTNLTFSHELLVRLFGRFFVEAVGILLGNGVVSTVLERPDKKLFLRVNLDRV